jgi:hypothetical protein
MWIGVLLKALPWSLDAVDTLSHRLHADARRLGQSEGIFRLWLTRWCFPQLSSRMTNIEVSGYVSLLSDLPVSTTQWS